MAGRLKEAVTDLLLCGVGHLCIYFCVNYDIMQGREGRRSWHRMDDPLKERLTETNERSL